MPIDIIQGKGKIMLQEVSNPYQEVNQLAISKRK